jgi:hypothetical protein
MDCLAGSRRILYSPSGPTPSCKTLTASLSWTPDKHCVNPVVRRTTQWNKMTSSSASSFLLLLLSGSVDRNYCRNCSFLESCWLPKVHSEAPQATNMTGNTKKTGHLVGCSCCCCFVERSRRLRLRLVQDRVVIVLLDRILGVLDDDDDKLPLVAGPTSILVDSSRAAISLVGNILLYDSVDSRLDYTGSSNRSCVLWNCSRYNQSLQT